MTQTGLSDLVAAAVSEVVDDVVRRAATTRPDVLPAVDLQRCRFAEQGDWTTTVALRLAPLVDVPAIELGDRLATTLARDPAVRAARVAGPGFVNLSARSGQPVEALSAVLRSTRPVPAGTSRPLDTSDLRTLRRDAVARALSGLGTYTGVDASGSVDPVGVVHVHRADGTDLADVDPATLCFELLRHPVAAPLTLDVATLARDAVVAPGYAVRYAAGRCVSLLLNAADLGIDDASADSSDALDTPTEARLVAAVSTYEEVVRAAAARRQPHVLARHLEETAHALLTTVAAERVLPRGDEEVGDRPRALLLAVRASMVVLCEGLAVLGLPAPVLR